MSWQKENFNSNLFLPQKSLEMQEKYIFLIHIEF